MATREQQGLGAFRRAGSAIAALMFPPACRACGAETQSDGLCGACFAAAAFLQGPACPTCGQPEPRLPAHDPAYRCPTCMADPPALDGLTAVARYEGPVRRLILALKHGDRLDHVPLLAGWLASVAGARLGAADAIVPVPLHWTRRLKRRFNQSAEIARTAAHLTGNRGAFAPTLLSRQRDTPSQKGRDRAARRANVAGAFRAPPGSLVGRRVLLVDDVCTSGATLDAAARACRAAGAESVDAAVIALVVLDRPPYLAQAAGSAPQPDQTPEDDDGR
ncbi:MAG: ComF family protein [Pseudomonadota bacterium]